jgi:hypothetical protein
MRFVCHTFIRSILMLTITALVIESGCFQVPTLGGLEETGGSNGDGGSALAARAQADRTTITLAQVAALTGFATGGTPPYTFSWSQIDGPAQTLTAAGDGTAQVTGVTKGLATFEVTATDQTGTTATATIVIQVILPPR